MKQSEQKRAPWWLRIQLWGLDAPVTALCWAAAYVAFMELPMVQPESLLLLAAFAWLANTMQLPHGALMQLEGDSRRFFAAKSLLKLLVALLACAMLLGSVGRIFIAFAAIPFVMQALGHMPLLGRISGWRAGFLSVAFALACPVPAFYSSVTLHPLNLLFFAPAWYLAILIYLHYLVHSCWLLDERAARRRSALASLGVVLLIVSCLLGAAEADTFERPLYLTLALAAAALELLVVLRTRLGEDSLFACDWLTTALPPVLGILLFL